MRIENCGPAVSVFLFVVLLALPVNAGVVTLKANDASGSTSFTGSTNWSNAAAPSSGNTYLDNDFLMRSPTAGDATFAGSSLTLTNNATLAFKTTGTLTFGTGTNTGLWVYDSIVANWTGGSSALAGYLTMGTGWTGLDPQVFATLNVSAVINGQGALTVDGYSGQYGGTVVLQSSNSYSGGTAINAIDTLRLSGAGTLGSVNASLTMNVIDGVTSGEYGVLDLNGTSQGVGNLTGNTDALILNSASATASTLTVGNGNATGGNFQGTIANGNGTVTLAKVGTGTITLSGTNTYTGGTTVSGGALQISSLTGAFSGGGTVVLMAPGAQTAQTVTVGVYPLFSGKWIVASGWLAGATNGAFGTNSSIIIDPQYVLDASAGSPSLAGTASFEPLYDLNTAGTLTLTNGGQMILHQNCAFTAVAIEGNSLSAGTYSYAELAASFPNNFPSSGAGFITVQPYGTLPANPPQTPQFTTQPASQTNSIGATVQFSASAYGNPAPTYQWLAGATGSGIYSNLINGGQFNGVISADLTISNLTASNAADYVVVASNASGSVTSAPATLGLWKSATVNAYPLPSIYTASATYSLTVNGTNIPVTTYTGDYDYAELSMSGGMATIQVTALTQSGITSYGISPLKLGLTGATSGNKLTFVISTNHYLIVQINSLKRLIIAADPAESSAPLSSGPGIFNVLASPYNADNTGSSKTSAAIQSAINDASVYGGSNGQGIVYVPAGVYLCGNLQFKSNMALYLQGGSVIRCTGNPADYSTNETFGPLSTGMWFLFATNGINMKIYGRGTVDADGGYMVKTENFAVNTLMPINCTNFIADGVTFRDAGGWTIIPCIAKGISFNNLKIFNQFSVGNDDGIDVNCSQNVMTTNVIAIGLDDSFSTKTYTSIPWPGADMVNSNIVFDNCLAWTICYGFKVGQGVEDVQEGITFKNGVVYDCAGALGIDHKNGASTVNNVTFDTIDVERVSQVNAGHGAWAVFLVENGLGDGGGPVTNIFVNNITVRNAGTTGGFIQGISSYASINGITFDDVYMPGSTTPASNLYQMGMTNTAFYSDVTILPTQTPEPLRFLSQPASQSSYIQQTAQFTLSAWGNLPLNYQWQVESNGSYVNLTDGGRIIGSQRSTLTISNVDSSDATNYLVMVSDAYDSPISSVPAYLTVMPALGAPVNATMSAIEPNASPSVDWNTASYWSNGLSVSNTAMAYPGSTFEILPGGGMRTPYNVSTAGFPGNILTVDGNGVWNNTANIGQIMLKNSSGGTVNFPDLVMKGGQLNNYVDSAGSSVITGVINVLSNTPIAAGNSGSGGSFQIASQLSGNGNIEYHAYNSSTFQPAWVCDLNVSGNNNTYSGKWNVVAGTLMATGTNALGTNTITVASAGALQTTYDMHNPNGALVLNGRMNLTQNDTFKAVTVAGVALSPGTYTFAQLNATHPTNFPASWVAQPGGSIVNGSGSITVLPSLTTPVTLAYFWDGASLTLTWPGQGTLLQATNIAGPWTTNAGAATPFTVTPAGPQMFFRIQPLP